MPDQRRPHVVKYIRLSNEEAEILARRAWDLRMSQSDVVRLLICQSHRLTVTTTVEVTPSLSSS